MNLEGIVCRNKAKCEKYDKQQWLTLEEIHRTIEGLPISSRLSPPAPSRDP
jgi:hypothetical protein